MGCDMDLIWTFWTLEMAKLIRLDPITISDRKSRGANAEISLVIFS
jgi:hypothetical protein